MDFDETRPRPIPGPPPSGSVTDPVIDDEAINDAVAGLNGLDALPVADHVERYDTVHVALTAALAGIDKV
ncbi:hypothetical protein SAMN05192558_1076 [Actinokineospora alba]|uniref:Uncharacterized protein n=1 Tax=Actinokineospora alba TaxID=504798 RepID=A0A1H0QIT7_9PSEU|nr:hypothetical protein [Actinokineospora alba]TDP70530.1 hypothetical protein C8E96_6146 [Actinokineospora alba]SDI29195.1 hypothetical protein SAMN05421871_1045 [Actinokineospora alba]SDP17214.1 hypothetical protein SAMN05192558_1076 [Actinokineospora alba]